MWCQSLTFTGYKNLGDDGYLMGLNTRGKMEPAWQETGALHTMTTTCLVWTKR